MIRLNRLGVIAASLTTAIVASEAAAFAQTHAFGVRPLAARPALGARPFVNSTARSTFVAGGATLPALGYEGSGAKTANPSTPSSTSLFGYLKSKTGVTTQYCQTGSGFGRNVFTGAAGATGGVNGACAAIGVNPAATNGFGAPSTLGLTQPDMTGTDIPMSQGDYTNFLNNKGGTFGEPVSVPSIIGSVAFLFNYSGQTLALSDSQVCNIVGGKITNWSSLGKPSAPLTVVYRLDGSGTTFSLSNHLTQACSSYGFNASQNFASQGGKSAPFVFPGTGAAPANFVGVSGNQGIANYVASHAYAIGYVETANALDVLSTSVKYATVNGKDPVKNLPETAAALSYNATNVTPDGAIVTSGGAATVAKLSGVKKSGCVQIVNPSAYARPTAGYPIVAVTNLLFNSNGNGSANAANLRNVVTYLNTPSLFGTSITSIDHPTTSTGTGKTGYAALGSTFNSALISTANSCIGT